MLRSIRLSTFPRPRLGRYLKLQSLSINCTEIHPNSHNSIRCSSSNANLPQEQISSEISKAPARLHYITQPPLIMKTVGELLGESSKLWPYRDAIISIHQNIRLNYIDLVKRVDCLAAGLKKLGVKKGDSIGLWGPNDIEWYITFMAAMRIGGILVGINHAYEQAEINYSLEKAQVKVLFCPDAYKTQNFAKMALEAKKSCPKLEHIIVYAKDHVTGTRRFSDVESLPSRKEVESIGMEQLAISSYDPCNIQFTSGTTGKPKATIIIHGAVVNSTAQCTRRAELGYEDKICLNVPFFHGFALVMALVANLCSGCAIVLEAPTFNPVKSVEALAKEKCTVLYGTPTMWVNLMDVQHRLNVPTNIRVGTTGGAPMSSETYKRIRNTFRFDKMKTIYGLTETMITFQSLPGESHELTETTVGHLSDHMEAMVVDDNGTPVPFGTGGELWMRSYGNMLGYWNDVEATKKTITEDGWLKTGDRFILREDGYGQIIGRYKDMIIRGGENIFPREIEDFLLTHPQLIEVHVVGAYDEVYGEEICACIRVKEGAKVTKDDVRNYCKGKIARFKIPRYIEFVTEYPKTGSGKVQKFRLVEELEAKGLIPTRPK